VDITLKDSSLYHTKERTVIKKTLYSAMAACALGIAIFLAYHYSEVPPRGIIATTDKEIVIIWPLEKAFQYGIYILQSDSTESFIHVNTLPYAPTVKYILIRTPTEVHFKLCPIPRRETPQSFIRENPPCNFTSQDLGVAYFFKLGRLLLLEEIRERKKQIFI
jgi:hypothetical protein